jgi:hypothetical protein
MNDPFIVIGSPHNGTILAPAALSIRNGEKYPNTIIAEESSSVLTYAFNSVWCKALNITPRPDYFVMHHADIEADKFWLADLVDIIKNTDADVVSCNIAIKDDRGLTSTAVWDPLYNKRRRLTLKELNNLPSTFGITDIQWAPPACVLLLNTGLWICKIGDWCEKICFRNQDFIEKKSNGKLVPGFWPEDWLFSIDCHNLGLKVLATSQIVVEHCGFKKWRNRETSLTLDSDEWYSVRPVR